jgi:hypothetical protein
MPDRRSSVTLCSLLFLSAGACATAWAADIGVNCANAAGDGKTLNAAIAASKTGDAVHIHGTCLTDQTIVLNGNRSYFGDSRTGTVIRQANGANLPALAASDSWDSNAAGTGGPIRIAHLTLDGNRANNTGTSALVIRSWLTVIEDLQVRSAPVDGIRLTNLSKDGKTRLTSTQVNGRISNCFITGSGANGVHVADPGNSLTDWDLLDSWIANSGESAIRMDNAAGWKVAGNHLYGVKQHAIYAHRCWGTTIADNYIEGFGEGGGDDAWYGIACTAQGGSASVIRDNKVFRSGARPGAGKFIFIGVPQVNSGVGVINVVDNVIRGGGSERDIGLSYQAGPGAGLSILSGNNNVQSVGTGRLVGEKVTLVNPL